MKTYFTCVSGMTRRLLFGLAILMMSQAGCKKEIDSAIPASNPESVNSMVELKVAPDFNWKTTRDVSISLTAAKHGAVIIKSSAGSIYEKAMLLPGELYLTMLAIPSSEQFVILVFGGKSYEVKIAGDKISYTF